jgi:flagellar biosynthesis protein FliP
MIIIIMTVIIIIIIIAIISLKDVTMHHKPSNIITLGYTLLMGCYVHRSDHVPKLNHQ